LNLKSLSSSINRLPLVGAALLWSGLHAWVLHQYFGLEWRLALWDSFVFNLLILNGALLLGTLLNYLPKTGIFQIVIGLGLVLSFASEWISYQAIIRIVPEGSAYLGFVKTSAPVRWALGFIILAGVGIGMIYYLRWKELMEAQSREADMVVLAREAELQKLQVQLQPHFLFNSLNSINALILVQPDQARKMVQQLSDFLRLTLKRADEPWVSLAQELEYLETYLAIEKVRFGHRLEVELYVEEGGRNWSIPTLVLQPLLENAIKFGLYGTTGRISIRLTALVKDNQLEIEITNPFDSDMQPLSGSGFGLAGLQRRLYLIYARNDLIQTNALENKFTVNLKLPSDHDQSHTD
jgi:two-component system, LytTR family, sensor kinase